MEEVLLLFSDVYPDNLFAKLEARDEKMGGRVLQQLDRGRLREYCARAAKSEQEYVLRAAMVADDIDLVTFIVAQFPPVDDMHVAHSILRHALLVSGDDMIDYLMSREATRHIFLGDPEFARVHMSSYADCIRLIARRRGACLFYRYALDISSCKTLISVAIDVRTLETARYLESVLSSCLFFGFSGSIARRLFNPAHELPLDLVCWYIQHPRILEDCTLTDMRSDLIASGAYPDAIEFIDEYAKKVYCTPIFYFMYSHGLESHIHQHRKETESDVGLFCSYLCRLLVIGRHDQVLPLLDPAMLALFTDSAAERLVSYVRDYTAHNHHIMSILLTHFAPKHGDRYLTLVSALYCSDMRTIDDDMFEAACYANRRAILPMPGWLPTILRRYNMAMSYHSDPAINTGYLYPSLVSRTRVAVLLFCGLCPRLTTISSDCANYDMIRVARGPLTTKNYVVIGGQEMKRAVRAFFVACDGLPLELMYSVMSFIDLQWYRHDSGMFAASSYVISVIMSIWSSLCV